MNIDQLIQNLHYLKDIGKAKDMIIRVPHIPGFNNQENITENIHQLNLMGFENIDEFEYRPDYYLYAQESHRLNLAIGGMMCNILSAIRKEIASTNGIGYELSKCNNEKYCAGTCPKCDWELKNLQEQLDAKCLKGAKLNFNLINSFPTKEIAVTINTSSEWLLGVLEIEDDEEI